MNNLLKDVTFVIPFRIETREQIKIMDITLDSIACRFASHVILLEAGEKRRYRKRNPTAQVSYSFIEDRDPVFRRTRYLNILYASVHTRMLAVWEIGLLVPDGQIIDAVEQVRKNRTLTGLPHDGTIRLLTPEYTDLYKKTFNISVLLRGKYSFQTAYGKLSVSGGFIADTEKLRMAGGENENLTGDGMEDCERIKRMEIFYDMPVYKSAGCAFRMYPHIITPIQNRYTVENRKEFLKICKMDQYELREYIKNWPLNRNNNSIANRPVLSVKEQNAMRKTPKPPCRLIALYLPQYYPVAENDRLHGKGYTEWTAVGRAKALYKGHYQPRIPADLGYYDLRLPEVREAQAELAREAGIEGFCYWHYWLGNGKRLLDRPFREVLESGKPDFPFCLAWANDSWKGFYHGIKGRNILVEQNYYGTEDYRSHFYDVLPSFLDHRYIRVRGRPVFLIYKPLNFPDMQLFIDLWQMLAQRNGLKGIYFVGQCYVNPSMIELILKRGFDAVNTVRMSNDRIKPLSKPGVPNVYRYADMWKSFLGTEEKAPNIIPTLIPNWDHSPRSGNEALIFHGSTPRLFEKHLEQVLETIKHKPEQERIAVIKSWNEWGEGNYLEPDLLYGKAYLDVIRKKIYMQPFRKSGLNWSSEKLSWCI